MLWNDAVKRAIVIALALGWASGCVYYNTFFNARKAFNEAEKNRKESSYDRPRINTGQYQKAIDKSLKVIEYYPNSKWYDDALYVLAVSYYWTKRYAKAERRCREILAEFPDSKYAKEAKMYLAKSWLQQGLVSEAMEKFEELFNSDFERSFKAEAAMTLGKYHFENKEYDAANRYFIAVRDSLGTTDREKKTAQNYIADGYFQMFRFNDALGAYLQILGMNPDNWEKYHALYQAAVCSYLTLQIDAGMDYLQTLIKDEIYFDSIGVLKLKVAEGYELEGDLEAAEAIYRDVASQEQNKKVAAQAFYNLGLTYQFDYDSLTRAKEYYDKVVELDRGSEIGQDALQRSSDIGKLKEYARTIQIDSSTTQQMIDEAARTQYLLAELYWFKLNKPDSAILEMQYLIDSFPSASEAPKAMIALSQMVRDHEGDTAKADSILSAALQKYPHSDYVAEILQMLGLRGSDADTGYAGVYIERAEEFLVDEENIDSARYYYQYIVDNFPDSKFYLQARFALIWLTERYESPGDSSVYLAYHEFADSFPGTYWANEAIKRTQYTPPQQAPVEEAPDTTSELSPEAEDQFAEWGEEQYAEDTSAYVDPLQSIYIAPDSGQAYDLPVGVVPIETLEPFVFPTEAYSIEWQGDFDLVFQIKLDFTGRVEDLVLKTHSGSDELDRRATETIASMTFDVSQLSLEQQGLWFVYKYRVTLPEELR
ncbi:MAG: tetratricopeptide repeat protein [Candidatus Zixiibacteriota bacterium]